MPIPGGLRRMAGGFSDAAAFLLPSACLGCRGWIPPGEPRWICRRCDARLRPFPSPHCGRCGAPRIPGTGEREEERDTGCGECRDWPPVLSAAHAAVRLHPPAGRLLHALKYGGWRGVAEPLAARMRETLRTPEEGTVVVPVPTTATRLRHRGYNQARELSSRYAEAAGLPHLDLLLRAGRERSQVGLHRSRRRANVREAFRLLPGSEERLFDRPVLLVDDVLTTGATAIEAATVLGDAGASRVTLLTFARALPE